MSYDSDLYIFSTDTLPNDLRFLPPLANGLLGWRVYNDIMHMGGVYNGEGGRCHRADVPCPMAVKVEMEEPADHTYSLNTQTGESVVSSHTVRLCDSIGADRRIVSLRHFQPHSELRQSDCHAVSLLPSIPRQPDGDGDLNGEAAGVHGACHCKTGQFIHTSEPGYCI